MREPPHIGVPALNNQELREKQLERFSEGIGQIGDYAKEMKKISKQSALWGMLSTVFFLVIFAGIVIYSLYQGGGLDGFIDTGTVSRHFNCTSERVNDSIRSYADAKIFTEIYNGTCTV